MVRLQRNDQMTKEEYVQRVFDARLRMCEEVMDITNDYVCEHASEIPEVSTDGLYLEYDKKNPADVHLSFAVRLSCDFPNIRPLKNYTRNDKRRIHCTS